MEAKKICAYKVGKVRIESYEIPHIGEEDVLIKTLYSTISPGTELAWINHMENTPGKYPYEPGYSCCGRIIQTGSKVKKVEVGDIVVCNYIHCSEFVIPEKKCTRVPESIDPKEASAFRLASISLQGVRKADIQIGDRVAVLGLGPIGNLAAQMARVAGAGETTGFDFVEWRRRLAEECKILPTAENGDEEKYQSTFDVVIEATGVPQAINTALKMVKPLGKVVLLGSTRGCTDGVNFYRDVHRKGIVVIGAHEMHRSQDEQDAFGHFRSHKKDEETVIHLLAQGRVHMEPLVSEVTEPERTQEIYQRLLEKKEQLMLAAFRWCSE